MTKFQLTLLVVICVMSPALAQESGRVRNWLETRGIMFQEKVAVYRVPVGIKVILDGMPYDREFAILLTDAYRDVAAHAQQSGAKLLTVGEPEKKFLTAPLESFWNDYLAKGRFNEESCASTNRPFTPIDPSNTEIRGVKDGDIIAVDGCKFHVLDTPGMSSVSVSYYHDLQDDHGSYRYVFTGDLICGDGRIANMYDLQDRFPEAEIGPYHGYMARVPRLIESLEK
ncbi:MAG: hypothetical protein FWH27_06915, partial [Planctomycetaceae bacterium]|nr:hypothetical protein [Planctomycetaceae bacterium]